MTFSELPIHHALLITHPNRSDYANTVWEELQPLSPAHRFFNQTVLDIETARELIAFAQSPYSGEKVALVSFHTASVPAQNALLKILEEPKGNVRFILVTTNRSNLIDTILSRVRHISLRNDRAHDDAYSFLQAPHSSRMKLPMVTAILESLDEEGRKDREKVKSFILSIADALRESGYESRYIAETLQVASYASDPSSSGKALLEYLSLLLPNIK